MKRLFGAAVAALFFCAPASAITLDETFNMLGKSLAGLQRAVESAACMPAELAVHQISAATLAFDVLGGDRAKRALALLKEAGQDPDDADLIIIGITAESQLVFFWGKGGAVCGATKVPEEATVKVFELIYGRRV